LSATLKLIYKYGGITIQDTYLKVFLAGRKGRAGVISRCRLQKDSNIQRNASGVKNMASILTTAGVIFV
jgi:hypothetical protein